MLMNANKTDKSYSQIYPKMGTYQKGKDKEEYETQANTFIEKKKIKIKKNHI